MRIVDPVSSKMCEFQAIRLLIFKNTYSLIMTCENTFLAGRLFKNVTDGSARRLSRPRRGVSASIGRYSS